MSRSLRSRPLTLYDNSSVPAIPPVQQDVSSIPSRSTSNQRLDQQQPQRQYSHDQQQQQQGEPASGQKVPSRLKKASQVGSNLKKRLSTRYADDNRRTSRLASMGADVLDEMPGYLTLSQHQQLQRSAPSAPAYEQQQVHPHQAPVASKVFREEDEDAHEDLEVENDNQFLAYPPDVAAQTDKNSRYLQSHTPLDVAPGRSAAKQPQTFKASSSRQPTLAWEGSSLGKVLDENRREGLEVLVDLQVLRRNDNFDGMEYLRMHLPPSVQPSAFSQTLDKVKGAIKSDVKVQIFDHYSDFILISSQVAALENEMIELKSLLTEWRGMPRLLEREDESGKSLISSVSILSKRSSILSLQQVYRAQLTSLWEGITNSQKFIPYKPGRHLIAEAPDFVELNSVTYKPLKNVALFLLDDLLLVASRKKGRMSTKVKLEAERSFALGDIVVVDLKDSSRTGASSRSALTDGSADSASSGGGIKDSIKIKRGKETFVYRAEKTESKKALLNAFRRVAEDLANRKKREAKGGTRGPDGKELAVTHGAADIRRQSIYAGMNFDHRSQKSGLSMLAGLQEEALNGLDTERTDADADDDGDGAGVMKLATERVKEERKDPTRWLNDWSDGLAVDVALRRWFDAVEKISKGKAMLSTYTPADAIHAVLSDRLSTHTTALVTSLLSALKSTTLRKGTLVSLASHLTALGYSSIARQTFLSTREELLRKRKRSIKFEGDTELYVSELSMVVFGMVRNTSEWFMAAWKESGMASGFVKWALAQVHSFALTFRRQVYGNSVTTSSRNGSTDSYEGSQDSAERARTVAMESAQQLKDVGLDFTFVLRELLKTEKEQAALARAATAAVVASQSKQPYSSTRTRASSGASSSTTPSRATVNSSAVSRPSTPKDGYASLPSTQPSPKRRGGIISSRIADFESTSGTASSTGVLVPSSPRSARAGLTNPNRPSRSTSVSSNGSAADDMHPFNLGRSSSRSGSLGAASNAPPVPPLPSSSLPLSSATYSAGVGSQRDGGISSTVQMPVVPSLTLTLADEASGISHRISSTDLPLISAQEIRKRWSGYHLG